MRNCKNCNKDISQTRNKEFCSRKCTNDYKKNEYSIYSNYSKEYKRRIRIRGKMNVTKITDKEKKELVLFLTKLYKQKFITEEQFIYEFLKYEDIFFKNYTAKHTTNLKLLTEFALIGMKINDFENQIYKLKKAYENYLEYLNSINARF